MTSVIYTLNRKTSRCSSVNSNAVFGDLASQPHPFTDRFLFSVIKFVCSPLQPQPLRHQPRNDADPINTALLTSSRPI